MSFNFGANQFNDAFTPAHLNNWEVPKNFRSEPRHRKGYTKFISDNNGHLLPNAKRQNTAPWGEYRTTWELPKSLFRNHANRFNEALTERNKPNILNSERGENFLSTHSNLNDDETNSISKLAYIPGDVTSPGRKLSSREVLIEKEKTNGDVSKLNELYIEDHQCTDEVAKQIEKDKQHQQHIPHVLGEGIEDNFERMKIVAESMDKVESETGCPVFPASYNFQMAKKMAQENLQHHPLADCVMEQVLRKIQAQNLENPKLATNILSTVSGIGIKRHKAGPTHCTKLRVYRPQTCEGVSRPLVEDRKIPKRPQTSQVYKDKMGAMELAICWDYKPDNPEDEPKRSKHIDGSNGSAAPPVFALVKSPILADNATSNHSGGVFTSTESNGSFFDKDILRKKSGFLLRSKSTLKCTCDNLANSSRSSKAYMKRSKSGSRHGSATFQNNCQQLQ